MSANLLPPPAELFRAFIEEATRAGGTVNDHFEDGTRLYARAILPLAEEVIEGDIVSAGVAIRAVDEEVLVCPYTFREVCRNGAIRAHATETLRTSRVGLAAPTESVTRVLAEIRRMVRLCATGDLFQAAVSELDLAVRRVGGSAITMMPYLMQSRLSTSVLARIYEAFLDEKVISAFHLLNAVTSTARDEKDPEIRWQLEALGGAIPAMLPRATPPRDAAAESEAASEYNDEGWATTRTR